MARSVGFFAHVLISMYADGGHRALQVLSAATRYSVWADADGVLRDGTKGTYLPSDRVYEPNQAFQMAGYEVYTSHTDGIPIMPLFAT